MFEVSALFFDEKVEEKGEDGTIALIHLAAPSPVVVKVDQFKAIVPSSPYLTRSRQRAKQQEKVGLISDSCMSSPCTWLSDLGSLTSKRKRCSLFKLFVVKLSAPGMWLVVVVALSLMSTTL